MNWPKLTKIYIISIFAVIIIYDVIAYIVGTPGGTISRVIYDWIMAGKMLPCFMWAGLLGHFFWPTTHKWNINVLVIISVPFILTMFFRIPLLSDVPMVTVLVGFYSCHRFFGMIPTQYQYDNMKYKKLKMFWYSL